MKKILKLSALAVASALLLAGCDSHTHTAKTAAAPTTKMNAAAPVMHSYTPAQLKARAQLVNGYLFSTVWMQQSGEYRALCYQAFNAAENHVMKIKQMYGDRINGKKIAVVVDLDETMLDNEYYSAWNIEHDQPFTMKSWYRWMESEQSTATPGSVAFSHFVENHGDTIFYISNRSNKYKKYTVALLKKLGFANVSDSSVILRTTTSDKVPRFNEVKARGYDIIIHIGDNLSDLTGDTWHQPNKIRRAWVNENKHNFGEKYYVIPNPIYGGWVTGLAKDIYSVTPAQKIQIFKQNLIAWNGQPSQLIPVNK